MRIWFKMYKDARLLRTDTITDDSKETRTHKVFSALEEICHIYDLAKPIWLESNIEEFRTRGKTRFCQDHFIEEIDFDYLEMHIIEEDDKQEWKNQS